MGGICTCHYPNAHEMSAVESSYSTLSEPYFEALAEQNDIEGYKLLLEKLKLQREARQSDIAALDERITEVRSSLEPLNGEISEQKGKLLKLKQVNENQNQILDLARTSFAKPTPIEVPGRDEPVQATLNLPVSSIMEQDQELKDQIESLNETLAEMQNAYDGEMEQLMEQSRQSLDSMAENMNRVRTKREKLFGENEVSDHERSEEP